MKAIILRLHEDVGFDDRPVKKKIIREDHIAQKIWDLKMDKKPIVIKGVGSVMPGDVIQILDVSEHDAEVLGNRGSKVTRLIGSWSFGEHEGVTKWGYKREKVTMIPTEDPITKKRVWSSKYETISFDPKKDE